MSNNGKNRVPTLVRGQVCLLTQPTTAVQATVAYNATSKKAVLDPTNDPRSGATYIATLTTMTKDLAGNRLDQNRDLSGNQRKTWRFTIR